MTFGRMALGILLVGLGILALLMPAHSDTFWHLRAGADIWRTGQVPRVDRYSYTVAGRTWPDHEWLSQAFMYLCYRLGGMPGVELGAASVIGVGVAVVYRLMVGPLSTRIALMAVGLSLSSLLWVLRPQIVSLTLLLVLIWLLARGRYRFVPALFLVWANAHGGVALGGLVLVVATACAAWRWLRGGDVADRHRLAALAVVLPLAALATAATPLHFAIFRFVLDSTARLQAAHVTEWGPPLPTGPFEIAFWMGALGLIGLLIHRRRALVTASWADLVVVASAFAVLALAVRSMRNIGPFWMVAVPAASRLLGADFRFPVRPRAQPASPDHPAANLALLAGVAAAGAAIVALSWRADAKRLDWHPIGAPALAALQTCPGPLYNRYYEGGFLIWFAPDRPVFIDNRQDPYPLAFLQQHIRIEQGAPYQPVFDRYGIRCAFLPASSKMTRRLRADGWRPRFLDDSWAVLAAPGSA
jgi:hypothetical protein